VPAGVAARSMSHFFKTALGLHAEFRGSFTARIVVNRRVAVLLQVMGVVVASASGGAQASQSSVIDRAGWLAGCWEMRAPNRVTMEMWMPPSGGMMLGASRTTVGASTREFEQIRLHAAGDTLVYTALPSGQREAAFRSTSVSATELVFENPAHDFPRKITYRRVGEDSVVARVEGPGPNNTTRGFNIPMRRASCTERPAPQAPPDTVTVDAEASPDGTRLAVVRGVAPNWDVFLMNADGSGARRLTDHGGIDYQPAWSPDGQRIAFVSVRDGHQEIYTVRPDGSELTQLTRGSAHNSEPAWAPDGKAIVFRSERDGRPQVYVMQADGSGQRSLTRDSVAAAPAWSPDGRRILFSSSRNRRTDIWVMNADGTGHTQLTNTSEGHSGLPFWSPNGSMIAFWSTRDGNDEVYVMGADGSNPKNISRNPSRDTPVGWTRDGAYILFRSTRDRAANDIYRMKPDGSDVTRVTVTR
jgi:dipeptidyl aminopeptidase/acylaminoacyl peptidase